MAALVERDHPEARLDEARDVADQAADRRAVVGRAHGDPAAREARAHEPEAVALEHERVRGGGVEARRLEHGERDRVAAVLGRDEDVVGPAAGGGRIDRIARERDRALRGDEQRDDAAQQRRAVARARLRRARRPRLRWRTPSIAADAARPSTVLGSGSAATRKPDVRIVAVREARRRASTRRRCRARLIQLPARAPR